jgi:hypothetical protein
MDELAARVSEAVTSAWRTDDPEARVAATRRPDGKLDITVISRLFDSLPSVERERLLWSVLRSFPPDDTVRMTYSLLVTPAEAVGLAIPVNAPVVDADRKDSD